MGRVAANPADWEPSSRRSRSLDWSARAFTQEFVELLEQHGGLAEPVRYGNTYTRVHDPLVWREAGDFTLAEAGVRVGW